MHARRTVFQSLLWLGHHAGWALLLLGAVLQLFIRDRLLDWPVVSLLFYGLPKPCLALLAAILALWPRVSRRWRGGAAVVALAFAGWWAAFSWCHAPAPGTASPVAPHVATNGAPTPSSTRELKVLYWNLGRPKGLHQGMVDLMRQEQPDVAAFVEPGVDAGTLVPEYEKLLPGYQVAWMPRGILWLSRVPSRYRDRGKLESIGAYAWFDVEGFGPVFRLVVADVHPHIFRSRKGQLDEALGHAGGLASSIMVGDFNTPLESTLWQSYRKDFAHAFEVAGSGWRETWPLGLPLLSLDHVWVGKSWQVVEARKVSWPMSSDHAALVTRLRWVRD